MQPQSFLVDSINIYEIIGREQFVKLSTEFYDRVYSDDDEEYYEVFRKNFEGRPKDESIRNQYEFFIQRFGGPPLYSERKGHPALRGRHNTFLITKKSAERWMYHMKNSIKAMNFSNEVNEALLQFLEHTANFLINAE